MLDCYKTKPRSMPAVITIKGREVCNNTKAGRDEYKRRRWQLAERQDFKCAICQRLYIVMEFDHQTPRGAGGFASG